MAGKGGRLILVLMAVVLLLTLALSFAAPATSALLVDPWEGAIQMAGPVVGGGSGA